MLTKTSSLAVIEVKDLILLIPIEVKDPLLLLLLLLIEVKDPLLLLLLLLIEVKGTN